MGTVDCNGMCVDTMTDGQNCGMCGNVCGPDDKCRGGQCGPKCGPTGTVALNMPPTHAAGAGPSDIARADLDGDGYLDLVTTNPTAATISGLLGKGDGTFKSPVPYPVTKTPVAVTLADVSGDGKLDAITANDALSGTISVLFGKGDGTFSPQTSYGASNDPKDVIAADVNSDAKLDIIVSNRTTSKVSVLVKARHRDVEQDGEQRERALRQGRRIDARGPDARAERDDSLSARGDRI